MLSLLDTDGLRDLGGMNYNEHTVHCAILLLLGCPAEVGSGGRQPKWESAKRK